MGTHTRLLLTGVVFAVAFPFAPSTPVPAATAPDTTGSEGNGPDAKSAAMQVDAGWAGAYDPTIPMPVRVTLTADRLVRTNLIVQGEGPPIRTPIEIAGGSRKRVTILVPTSESTNATTVRVHLEGGPEPTVVDVQSRADSELVGVTEGVRLGRALPAPAALSVDAGQARFAALGEELSIPGAIAGLSAIAATPTELGRLRPSVRAEMISWVESGGQLLVAGDRGMRLAGWPAGLQPDRTTGTVRFGDGVVVAAGRSLGSGSWERRVAPTPIGERKTTSGGFGRRVFPPAIGDELITDTGLRVPRVRWLMPAVVGYLTVGGALLLSRRRTLRFVALPVLAAVLTGGIVAAGRSTRSQVLPAHGTILDVTAGGTMATTYVGMARSDPGIATAVFPRGWSLKQLSGSLANGATAASSVAGAEVRNGRLRGEVDLPPAGFGVVAASGPVASRGGIEVVARAELDDQLAGTVHNTTPWVLHDVAVFTGAASTLIGDLTPGETRNWTTFVPDLAAHADSAAGTDVWPTGGRFGAAEGSTPVNFPAWWDWASTRVPELFGPGRAVAVGWTRDRDMRIDLGGKAPTRANGRTAVVSRAMVAGDERRPPRLAVPRLVVRTARNSTDYSVARFDLPATSGPLQARAVTGTTVDIWNNGRWESLQKGDELGIGADGGASDATFNSGAGGVGAADGFGGATAADSIAAPLTWTETAIPGSAVRDGAVHLRTTGFYIRGTTFPPVTLLTLSGVPASAPTTSASTSAPPTTGPAGP